MTIQKLCEVAGFRTRAYSGRGMMGKYCLGVESDYQLAEFVSILLKQADNNFHFEADSFCVFVRDFAFHIASAKQDTLGKNGYIIYFPELEYVEKEE